MMDIFLIDRGDSYHPTCDPQVVLDERNIELRQQIMEMVNWVDQHDPRSQQVAIGPSEIGNACDQAIGRILAGSPQVNFRIDPWAKLVGTAIHSWLEQAVGLYKDAGVDSAFESWRTEMAMPVDDMINAHSDLYNGQDVIDWKTSTSDLIKHFRRHGLRDHEHYRVQLHTYGLAHEKAGRPVRDVVLVFFPRAGWLKDMYLYREPYDRSIAINALKRVYDIGYLMIEAGVDTDPTMWAQVPMAPGPGCWTCPFNNSNLGSDQGPGATGCPGTNGTKQEMDEARTARAFKGIL